MLKPTEKQLRFLDWEVGVFFHFGIRTFYEGHSDWDGKDMPADAFNPAELDCEQWVKMAKAGGATYAVLTCKHHDGFANWPTKYSEYSVKSSPWKDGKGDVVREYTDACRKHGLKVGLYYSPAQKDFKLTDPKEYDDYFINQISELLTGYGKIDYLWFDGCGSEEHEYDKARIIKTIRGLQPDILIFSMWDPDVQWVGNEEGIVPCNTSYIAESEKISINETEARNLSEKRFMPYECDCKVRRHKWFYSENDEEYLRSAEDIVALYYYSVGRGGNLLLNFAPDRRGLIPEKDCEVFKKAKEEIDRRFEKSIECSIEKVEEGYRIVFPVEVSVNHMVLEEELAEGQKIKGFELCHKWFHISPSVYAGSFVGHKAICQFPEIYTKEFLLKITDGEPGYKLNGIKFYKV